jgi:uncharacterized protein (DUF58 family)
VTGSLRIILGAIFGIVILGVATLQSEVVILAVPLMTYLFAAIFYRPEQVSLEISREILPEFAPQGTPITVKLTVSNQGAAVDEMVVQDILPAGFQRMHDEISQISYLNAQGRIELEYTVSARRGAYDTYETVGYARDVFGLFEQPLIYRTRMRLIVYPQYSKLDRIRIRPPQTRGFAGPIAARQGGSGIDFWAIREYQNGDPQRQINWRLAARSYNELYTNVFEQQRVADVGIILDARQRVNVVNTSGSLFDHSVQAAAALAESFLDDGNRVSLLIYGSSLERVYPGHGRLQRNRILKALSGVNPRLNYALENFDYLPTRLFPAQSQIILISPLAPDDIEVIVRMRARGYAVILVSPDPVSFESAIYKDFASPAYRMAYAERDFMLNQIRRCGVQVVNWRVDQSLVATMRQLSIPHSNRVSL